MFLIGSPANIFCLHVMNFSYLFSC